MSCGYSLVGVAVSQTESQTEPLTSARVRAEGGNIDPVKEPCATPESVSVRVIFSFQAFEVFGIVGAYEGLVELEHMTLAARTLLAPVALRDGGRSKPMLCKAGILHHLAGQERLGVLANAKISFQ
jgi:hypothetical protein